MSRPRDPNPSDDLTRATGGQDANADAEHPEELLAVYADGEASEAEAADVEAHLATCARCRDELGVARLAMDALHDLPELASPWVDAGSVAAAAGEPSAPRVSSLAEHRARRRGAIAAAVGLAAAAALVAVVFVFHPGGGGGASTSGAAASPGAAERAPAVSKDELHRVLDTLTGTSRSSAAGVGGAPAATGPPGGNRSAPEFAGASPTIAPDAVAGVPCARRASGQPDSAIVVYAERGVYQRQPVWIVGFVTSTSSGARPRVELIAVTIKDCFPVYSVSEPLAG